MSKRGNRNEKPQDKRLDNRRKKELKKVLSERYSISNNRKFIEFISLYIDSEAIARKYVRYYKKDKGQKNSEASESLNYVEVEKAAKYFKLNIDESLIKQIFKSSTGIRNQKLQGS